MIFPRPNLWSLCAFLSRARRFCLRSRLFSFRLMLFATDASTFEPRPSRLMPEPKPTTTGAVLRFFCGGERERASLPMLSSFACR